MRERTTSKRPLRWLIVALILLALGATLLVLGLRGPAVGPGISGPIGQASGASDRTGVSLLASATVKKSTFAARSVPVYLSIPAIGVSVSLSELGKTSTGAVAIPTSWNQPGWYKYGPTPGQEGSAAILGHVDSTSGPAVFYRLASLRPGDKVSVRLADGKSVAFVVIGLRQYSKDNFPSKLVYGPRPYSALQLITCAGAFDSATHHYLSNLVVFTKMVTSSKSALTA